MEVMDYYEEKAALSLVKMSYAAMPLEKLYGLVLQANHLSLHLLKKYFFEIFGMDHCPLSNDSQLYINSYYSQLLLAFVLPLTINWLPFGQNNHV
jgi:hypothetical protein